MDFFKFASCSANVAKRPSSFSLTACSFQPGGHVAKDVCRSTSCSTSGSTREAEPQAGLLMCLIVPRCWKQAEKLDCG